LRFANKFANVAVSMQILVKFPNFPQKAGLFMDNLGKNWQERYG
jgi:hypothetical protein